MMNDSLVLVSFPSAACAFSAERGNALINVNKRFFRYAKCIILVCTLNHRVNSFPFRFPANGAEPKLGFYF